MLKVLIADDEPRVGQLVKHLIHWDELGLSFVDICRDGRTALELSLIHISEPTRH